MYQYHSKCTQQLKGLGTCYDVYKYVDDIAMVFKEIGSHSDVTIT